MWRWWSETLIPFPLPIEKKTSFPQSFSQSGRENLYESSTSLYYFPVVLFFLLLLLQVVVARKKQGKTFRASYFFFPLGWSFSRKPKPSSKPHNRDDVKSGVSFFAPPSLDFIVLWKVVLLFFSVLFGKAWVSLYWYLPKLVALAAVNTWRPKLDPWNAASFLEKGTKSPSNFGWRFLYINSTFQLFSDDAATSGRI